MSAGFPITPPLAADKTISDVNMSDIPEKAVDKAEETLDNAKDALPKESNTDKFKKQVDKAADTVKQEAVAVGDALKDPAVSSSLLVAIAAGAGTTTYLHKTDQLEKIGIVGQIGIAVGSVVVGVLHYYGIKAATN